MTSRGHEWIPRAPIAFARAVSRPHARWAIASMLAVLVATAASRVMTYTLKLLTDAAIAFGQGRGDTSEIWRWALVFPGAYLANEVVWRTSGFCGMRWITGAVAEASRRLFGYLSEHSATYFADRFAGALVNKVAKRTSTPSSSPARWPSSGSTSGSRSASSGSPTCASGGGRSGCWSRTACSSLSSSCRCSASAWGSSRAA